MKVYRKLHSQSTKVGPVRHFEQVVHTVQRILGRSCDPSQADLFDSIDDFAVGYLKSSMSRKAVKAALMTKEEQEDVQLTAKEDHYATAFRLHQKSSKQTRALIGFHYRELVNKRINQHELWDYGPSCAALELLVEARALIDSVLGPYSRTEVYREAGFGNGASATAKRSDSQREKKFCNDLTLTVGAYDMAADAICHAPVWCDRFSSETVYINSAGLPMPNLHAFIVEGSTLDFVPKDAKTDRIIMKEPVLNGYLQKGIGGVIRKRLRNYRLSKKVLVRGIDLNTSGSLNRDLAREGSMHGYLGTVDMKAASDSISMSLVEFLLPDEWVKAIHATRSPSVMIGDRKHTLQMCGGMGNGYTFELESLIFWAIGVVCARRSNIPFAEYFVSIHGDDLLIPVDVTESVFSAFKRAGVVINVEKTFVSGRFRESCGGHYLNGNSVKPFYIKRQDGSSRGDWFWLANSLLLWLSERSESFTTSSKYVSLREVLDHVSDYAASGEPRKWIVCSTASRRAGLYGLQPYKLSKGWPLGRRVVSVTFEDETLPEFGRYMVALTTKTTPLSVLDMCLHKSEVQLAEYELDVERQVERDRWMRMYTFEPFIYPDWWDSLYR